MTALNKYARDIAVGFEIHSCTDITGFGLAGHAMEMAKGSEMTLVLHTEKLPVLPGVKEYAGMGLIPAGAYRNREYLEEEEKMLKDYLECDGLPERTVLRQQLKVAGLRILRNLVKDVLETEEETTQPELPRLKNNEERKEWLRNYKTWPLRHVDAYTGAKYYEYRFDNGAVLVAEEWKSQGDRYIPDMKQSPAPDRRTGSTKGTIRNPEMGDT